MHNSNLLIGLIVPVLQIVLLVVLGSRNLLRAFPLFCTYTIYSLFATIARLLMMEHPRPFFVLYWSTQIVLVIFEFLAIYEVFGPALERYLNPGVTRILALLAFLGVGLIAAGRSLYHPFGTAPMARFAAAAYTFVPGILLLEAVIFVACLALMFKKNQPVQWGRHKLGILLGFGLAASATFVIYLARFRFGPQFEFVFRYAPPAAYVSATVVWLLAFWGEESPTPSKKLDTKLLKQVADTLTRAADRAERDWRKLNFGPSAAD